MSRYEVPASRLASVREAVRLLRDARRVILTTHIQADGDGVGCQVALLSFLEAHGAEAWIVNPTPLPRTLEFLVTDPSAVLDPAREEARGRCENADLCVVVDTGERSRIGRVMTLVSDLPILVIDHHPPGDDALAAGQGTAERGVSLRDATASAAGELVFDVLWESGWTLSPPAVDGLYVAILTDTGSFRFSNATARVHRVAAELVERGAAPDSLYSEVYGNVPLRRVRLLQEILPTLDTSPDGRVAWMTVGWRTLSELGCTSEDLEGLVDYPRELEGVEVGLLFRELEDGNVKISLRSNRYVDVNALARSVGGGGHVRASGALMRGSLEQVRERVVAGAVAAARNGDGSRADTARLPGTAAGAGA
jgi:phosphoesterase RecJ-like protein